MSDMNISLSDNLADFVNTKVFTGQFSTASEYVEALIRADQRDAIRKYYEAECIKGLESGPMEILDSRVWDEMREEAMRRLNANSSNNT